MNINTVFTAKKPIPTNGNGYKKSNYSPSTSPVNLQQDVVEALKTVGSHGSVEIYVQDYCITQITARMIKKTKHSMINHS